MPSSVSIYRKSTMLRCPECNSNRLIKFGTRFARNRQSNRRLVVQQYQCKNCGRITVKPRRDESGGARAVMSENGREPDRKEHKEG